MDPQDHPVELRLRAAVESSPSGLLMIDSKGRIVLVNRQVEVLFGYSREELLGQPVELLVPQRFRTNHPIFRAGFIQDPRIRAMGHGRDLYGLRKDGTEVPVEIGLNPVATSEGMFVVSSIVDITGRKQSERALRESEERLRHSQKMEAVGTLAGGIAHDFNNILSAIIGLGELVRDAVRLNEALRADMDEILMAADRGRKLVERILVFSRRREAERRPVSIGPVTEEAVNLLRSTLPSTISIKRSIEPGSQRVLADVTAVHQVVMNLATNAAHAMPRGGELRINLFPHYVRDHEARSHPDLREGPYSVLSIEDTGDGMDEATLKRAFEPFFTTKEPGTGTGLGLAMVDTVMREHEGAVILKSTQGAGTTVRCFFPAIESEQVEVAPAGITIPEGHGERILYLDDEASLARLGERRLQSLNYVVQSETSGSRALELLRRTPDAFDVVITDYTMPLMTGLDVSLEVHRIRPDLPVIMLSGYVDELPEAALDAAGIARMLRKPVSLEDLATAVHEVLREGGRTGR